MTTDEYLDSLYVDDVDDVDSVDTVELADAWEDAYPRDDEPELTAYLHEVLWTDERDALGGELAQNFYELAA